MLRLLFLLLPLGAATAIFIPPLHDHFGPGKECKREEFMCHTGKCISDSWICDGEDDCPGGEDEENCRETKCNYNQFQCVAGSCIPDTWVCDGQADCTNAADESNCTRTCRADEFTCERSNWCIQRHWVCDGDTDCEDGSDEANCPQVRCRGNEFSCDKTACISDKWRCDGDFDCLDKTDEEGCPKTEGQDKLCRPQEFLCSDALTCLPRVWLCDGQADCPMGDDEASCPEVRPCRSEEHLCAGGDSRCLPAHKYCDGVPDCPDSSDEQNCTVVTTKPCSEEELDCGGGLCLPGQKACDGHRDCPDGSDEPLGGCGQNECQNQNGGCSQICVKTATGHRCACQSGFKLVTNTSCADVNECENPGACSHICTNEIGSFKCECLEGYSKDPSDRTRCKPTRGQTSLLFTRLHDIRSISEENHETTLVLNYTKSSAALDFLYKTGTIFWSDLSERKIYKTRMGDNARTVVLSNEVVSCDGLAVDWIYEHIYWTDTGKNVIEVSKLDGTMRKTLYQKSLDEPRAIVVNPLDGWLYWSDWGMEARIEKGSMDGFHRQTLVSFDIKWPNGLALDLVREKLYWLDAKLNSISSINYDGSGRTVILRSPDTLHHPFSISVFEDFVYWTDWEKHAIIRANKFNGKDIKYMTGARKIQHLMVVQAYHPYRQPDGTNHCRNNSCSHLCLPAPHINQHSPKITCACPDGLILEADGLQCITEVSVTHRPNHLKIPEDSPHMSPLDLSTAIPIIIASTILLLTIISAVAFIFYRNYRRKSVPSVNFDNPVYRKTTEDKFSLIKRYPQSTYIEDVPDEIQELPVPIKKN